ncbi:choloylglycine hydrolase family protein [Vagococcus vulneris]|uniref:Choloylglycine hydrolase n=1 Tax=Vagococcus vulneris TaxID=1977869 RepID=A0A429ZP87_9ENTE|nr:choloylglycine hydrolase family protein [Vagococcus vulneris]RST95512.1 choloylglycine hydrolase [Vagococcus vulneris]
MCTSLTLTTNKQEHFFARTMDFSFPLEAKVIYVPQETKFIPEDRESYISKFAFIGAGRDTHSLIFADGMNEKGFSIASLYFSGNATYSTVADSNKVNINATDFVAWALSHIASVAELEEILPTINLIDMENPILKSKVPLHWLVSDSTGETYVLEMTETGTHFYKNNVGVMTNSPDFPWHLSNLNHYSNLQPKDFEMKQYGEMKTVSDGPGSGALGLPGDYTSASRFIRTAFLREHTEKENGLVAVSHILNAVDIPKGVKIKADNSIDYTQYKAIMNLEARDYYFMNYEEVSYSRFSLKELILNEEKVKILTK